MIGPRTILGHFAWIANLAAVLGRDQRRRALVLAGLSVAESVLEMLSIGSVIPLVAIAADPNSASARAVLGRIERLTGVVEPRQAFLVVTVLLLGVLTVRTLLKIGNTILTARFAARTRTETAKRLLAAYAREPYELQLRADPNRRLAMVTGDSASIATLSSESIILVGAAAQVGAMAILMLLIDWQVTLASMGIVGLLAGANYLFLFRRLRNLGLVGMEARHSASAIAARLLQGYREAAIYDRDGAAHRAFAVHANKMSGALERVGLLRQVPVIGSEWLLGTAVVLGLLAVTLRSEFSAALPLAVAFAAAALRLAPAAVRGVSGAAQLRFHLASLDAVHRDLSTSHATAEPERNDTAFTYRQSIAFDNVSFGYKGSTIPSLTGVSLDLPQGTMLGVCGPSGAGKSTFVNLLMGLLTSTAGDVRVDGRSIRGHERAWQRLIALVPQDPFFWNASLRDNVLFGREFADADTRIWKALERAHLADFVRTLPKGLDTSLGDRGSRVSGGQRQRLAVARALVGDPELIVLDEPTSALDHEVAAAIDEALAELKGSKTLVIVAHRASSVARCDRVLYLVDGRLAGQGTFEQLAATAPGFSDVLGIAPPNLSCAI